jgi:hypothetical protein
MTAPFRLYPDTPRKRRSAVTRDVLTAAALVLFLVLGLGVRAAIDRLAVLGEGVESAGTTVQDAFDEAAAAVGGLPVVGNSVADGLTDAGEGTGGNVAELGRDGQDQVHRVADVTGLLVFAVPAGLVLLVAVPGRVREVRALNAAARVLVGADEPDRRRLIAMRAAFDLPYAVLLRYSDDPFGDLAAGRYDGLVAAVREDSGLGALPATGG